MVAQRVHLGGRREGIAVRNQLNTNPRRSLRGGVLFGERDRIRVQRQQSLHTMRHRLAKIRERLAMILVADTVNQQHRRIMVLTLTVQGTLRMRRSILSQPPLLTVRQRTTLQQMRHLRHASHLLASAHNAPANPLTARIIDAARCISFRAKPPPHQNTTARLENYSTSRPSQRICTGRSPTFFFNAAIVARVARNSRVTCRAMLYEKNIRVRQSP